MSRSRRAVVWKTALELLDQAGQLAFAAAQRLEGGGAVAEQLADRDALGVEDAEELVEVGEGRFELADRVGEVLALAVDRDRGFLHPALEGGSGFGVEGAEDLVELDRFGELASGTVPPSASFGPLRSPGVSSM